MAEYVKIGKTSEIEDKGAKCVEVGGKTLAVFNLGGDFYCIDDMCPHEDGPLSEGFVEGDEVECPWHAASFNIKTGKLKQEGPAYDDVATYKVRVSGDDIEVEV